MKKFSVFKHLALMSVMPPLQEAKKQKLWLHFKEKQFLFAILPFLKQVPKISMHSWGQEHS